MSQIIQLNVTDPDTAAAVQQLDQRLQKIEKNLPKPLANLITRKEVSALLSVSVVTIIDWDKKGILKPYKIGNRIRYKLADVESVLNDSRDEGTNS